MNPNKIAVDIVLIPPDEILKLAIDINKTFPNTAKEDYVLDVKTCIPHITLLMGLISRDQLGEINAKLGSVAEKFFALNLRATSFTSSPHPDGKIFSTLAVEKNS